MHTVSAVLPAVTVSEEMTSNGTSLLVLCYMCQNRHMLHKNVHCTGHGLCRYIMITELQPTQKKGHEKVIQNKARMICLRCIIYMMIYENYLCMHAVHGRTITCYCNAPRQLHCLWWPSFCSTLGMLSACMQVANDSIKTSLISRPTVHNGSRSKAVPVQPSCQAQQHACMNNVNNHLPAKNHHHAAGA